METCLSSGSLLTAEAVSLRGGSSLNGGEMMSVLAGVSWTDTDGTGHNGHPIACIPSGTQRRRVELGLVEYTFGARDRTARVVVRVRCLTQ
jgi:hypothetical protein